MKAITCSQCGALLTEFSVGDKFAKCDYCGAKIKLRHEKILEVSKNKIKRNNENLTPFEKHLKRRRELEKKYAQNASPGVSAHLGPTEENPDLLKFLIWILPIIIFGLFVFYFFGLHDAGSTENRFITKTNQTPTPFETFSPTPTPTPFPNISYRAYVKYNTALGAEHVQIPTIELEQLPKLPEEEIKKTVFKQKRVRVRITINKEGEVTDAKALNGHKVLRESSVRAANKSLFSTRRRIGRSTLTYIFILEN